MKQWLLLSTMMLIVVVPTMALLEVDHLPKGFQPPAHPRILLLENEESTIRKAIASDRIWNDLHGAILSECDAMMPLAPVERVVTGRRLLSKSRECLRRVLYLSYAWRMTGDAKYARRAEQELLAVSAFSDWHPSHFLDVAEMTMAAAIGYDWLHATLSEGSRNTIREAILKKGIQPSLEPRFSGWLKVTNNWNQVCNAGMSYGALAIFEDQPELARRIINRSIDSIPLAMQDYGPDGAYPEGYGYWGYGTNFNVMLLTALEKVFGTDFHLSEIRGFLKTAAYLEHMTGPSTQCFNYSDSGSQGALNPAMFWFAGRLKDASLLWLEKGYLAGDKGRWGERLLPATLIWSAGINLEKIVPPESTVWVGQGKNPVALMRSSWRDTDALFVGIKGGSASANHAHMDVGSFVMDSDGIRWAMDFGPQDYNSLESKGVGLWGRAQDSQRWQVFRYNNLVHNTLTFEGRLQDVEGYAPIARHSADPNFMHAQVDMTGTYKGQVAKAHRGVAIVDKQYVVIRDEITTDARETRLRWAMLTPAEVKITGDTSAELNMRGRTLRLQAQATSKVAMRTWSTQPTHDYDAPNPGTTLVGFETTLQPRSDAAVVVLLLPQKTGSRPPRDVGTLASWP